MDDKLALKLAGVVDARTQRGQFARGKNIYMGASHAPRTGSKEDAESVPASKQDLMKQAIARRLRNVRGGNKSQLRGKSNG